MKQTELEVGKEYWLDDECDTFGTFIGRNSKNDAVFEIKGSTKFSIGSLFDGYMTSAYNPKAIEQQWQFTTPIAMKCTEEQFNGIKDKLVEIGYEYRDMEFYNHGYIVSNIAGENGVISTLGASVVGGRGRTVFKSFNPDLFLALAAMTDKEDGIKGEWWIHSSGTIYLQITDGVYPNNCRKATAQEIIEHFEKKEFVLPEKWCVKVNEEIANIFYYVDAAGFHHSDRIRTNNWSWHIETGYTEITFDQFKKYVLKETAFSLPEKWCVRVTKENRQDLRLHFCNAIVGCWVLYNGNYNQFTGLPSGCTEITFEQFEKYVDKKTLKHSLANETQTSCPKATVVGSIECNINIEFDSKKAAEELFAKIVEFGKSSTPDYKFTTENWYTNDKKEVGLEYKTIIPIPPTKQATLFDDRVEITDWKPSLGEVCWQLFFTDYEFSAQKISYKNTPYHNGLFERGLIKRTESEAKQLVEKLKQATL